MPHSTSYVAQVLKVSGATIRTYTIRFGEFLSSEATPPPGERRAFTDDDLRLLHAAREMLALGQTYDQVVLALRQGVHTVEDWDPPEPEQPEPSRELVAVEQMRAWVAPLQGAVEAWRSLAEERRLENERLRQELRELRALKRPWWRFWP